MPKPNVNTQNFEILMQAILHNYDSFDVMDWGYVTTETACGSAGCIAGTADWLANRSGMIPATGYQFLFDKKGHVRREAVLLGGFTAADWAISNAKKWLNIDQFEAQSLFIHDFWPPQFRIKVLTLKLYSKESAQLAVDRIKYFLETGM